MANNVFQTSAVNLGGTNIQVGFRAEGSGVIIPTSSTNMLFSTAVFNNGNGYSTGTAVFIAPFNGVYAFGMNIQTTAEQLATTARILCSIFYGNTSKAEGRDWGANVAVNQNYTANCYAILSLTAGDEVSFRATSSIGTTLTDGRLNWSAGALLYPTS